MKNAKHYILILFIIIFKFSFASFDFTPNCKEAYVHMQYLRFNKAYDFIELEKTKNPKNKFINYNEHYLKFLEVLITDDKFEYNDFTIRSPGMLKAILNEKTSSPWQYYIASEMLLQIAITDLLHEKYFRAVLNLIRSFRYIQKNIQDHPHFELNTKLNGFYNLIFSIIPNDFKWITDIFGMKGDFEMGISQLENFCQYSSHDKLFEIEGSVVNFFLRSSIYEDSNLNNEYLCQLMSICSINSLVRYLVSSSLLRNGKNSIVNKIIFNNDQDEDEIRIEHFNYLKGVCKLYNNDEEAEVYLKEFLNNYSGKLYANSARLKLAWYYFLNSETIKYKQTIKNILVHNNNVLESDKQAYNEAVNKKYIDKVLLKSRILFDGGNYKKAIELLNCNASILNTLNNEKKVEFYYRLARSNQVMNIHEKALKYFKYVIDRGQNINDYYYAFALINSAHIYRDQKNYEKAYEYYSKCMHIQGNSFNYSFEYKVNKALNELYLLERSSLVLNN